MLANGAVVLFVKLMICDWRLVSLHATSVQKTGLSASISQKHAKYFTVPYKASLKVFSRLLAFDCVHSNLEEKYTMKRETDEYVGICVCLYLWHCIYASLYVPVIL